MTLILIPSGSQCTTFTVKKHYKSDLITMKYDLPPLALLTSQDPVWGRFPSA